MNVTLDLKMSKTSCEDKHNNVCRFCWTNMKSNCHCVLFDVPLREDDNEKLQRTKQCLEEFK